MPPELRAKLKDTDQQSLTLSDLPIELLGQVARHSAPGSEAQGHPLLRVARCGRDAVLQGLTRVSLDLNSQDEQADSAIPSTGRLLNRACRAAPTGLNVELALGQHANDLPELLRPAFDYPGGGGGGGGGWQNVHSLRIGPRRNCSRYDSYKEPASTGILALIAPAFPHLRHLHLHLGGAQLGGKGGLLDCLRSHPSLTSLHLTSYIMQPDDAVQQAASDLASLPGLVELELSQCYDEKSNPADLVSQLTGLTRLSLHGDIFVETDPMFQAAARNTSLRSLQIEHSGFRPQASADQVQEVLLACKQLTHLSFGILCALNQEVVDVLLLFGDNVSSLAAGSMRLEHSMVGQHWGITDLRLHDSQVSSVDQLAQLPLHTVTTLEFSRSDDYGLGFFELPMGVWNWGVDGVPEKLRQAAINLAACPAWQREPASKLELFGDPEQLWTGPYNSDSDDDGNDGEVVLPEDSFTQEQALALFEALAPLGGPHVKEVELSVDSLCFDLGEVEVETLGRSVRGGHASMVTTLNMSYCNLDASFWAALDDAFPALSTLGIGEGSSCARKDLTNYCIKRAAAAAAESPLKVALTRDLFLFHGGVKLQASLDCPDISIVCQE